MKNNNNYTITRNERKGETWYNLEGINTNWENGYNCAVASSIKELIKYMRRARALNPLATFTIDNSLNPVEVATITADAAKIFTAPKAPKYKNHSQDPAALLKIMRQIAKANNKEGRYNMECIYFDSERRMAVATDAHRLIASRAVYEQYPHFAGCMVNFENGHCYKCEEDSPFKSEIGRYPVWYNAIPKNPGKPITLYQQPAVLSLVSNQCAIGTNRTTGQPVCVNGKWYNELLPYFPAALCNDTPFRAVTSQTEELIVLIMPMMYDDDLPQYLNTLATDTTDTTTTDTPTIDTPTDNPAAILKAGIDTGHVIICRTPTNQKTARAVACSTPRAVTPMPSSQKTDNPATASQPLSIDRLKEIRKTIFDGKIMNRFVEFEDKTKDGETVGMEIVYCHEDRPTTNSLVTLWHKSGYTKEVLKSYICIHTYATLDNGMCYGYYNPQEKPTADGKRREINFDYMFPISEENEKKLIQAVADMANKGQKHITR